MKHACFLAAAVAVALLALAAPASATHTVDGLGCGDTIETPNSTVILQGNLDCSSSSFVASAFRITASNVTLRLDGHTISAGGAGLGGVAIVGGSQEAPLSGIRIYGGTIAATDPARHGFVYGAVSLYASDSYVAGMTSTSRGGGIDLTGDRNQVHLNEIEITAQGQSLGGIRFFGNSAHATRNTIKGTPQVGIAVFDDASTPGINANNPRIAVNTINSCEIYGIQVESYLNSAVVAKNTVKGCNTGIRVQVASEGAGGAGVRRNDASDNTFGISVNDSRAFVWCNTANNNRSTDGFFGTGIDIGDGAKVTNNTANNNAQIGIQGTTNTTDGGGNTASGNGTNCINVTCGPPPDPPCPAAGA